MDIQTARLRKRLAARQIGIVLDEKAKGFLAEAGYDPSFGARPLKRAIRRCLDEPLAVRMLEEKFARGSAIRVGVDEKTNTLTFEEDPAAPRRAAARA